MKKIFSILFVCCAAFVYAEEPAFEETSESALNCVYAPFAAHEPANEGNEFCNECDDPEHVPLSRATRPHHPSQENRVLANCMSWSRYKADFGIEEIYIRFPQDPTLIRTNAVLTAQAYDYSVLYSLTGYYPHVPRIDSILWFNEILYSLNQYPFALLSHAIFQASNGNWVLDYVSHDYVQDVIIKSRVIATPFNGYTLQCLKPKGVRDHFDYFVDSFWIN